MMVVLLRGSGYWEARRGRGPLVELHSSLSDSSQRFLLLSAPAVTRKLLCPDARRRGLCDVP